MGPDVDWGAEDVVHVVGAGIGRGAAGRFAVDVGLDYGGPDHCCHAGHEAGGDFADGSEADAELSETGVEEDVAERNEDYQGKGIEVVEDVVG